jgi:hypothetical protein
MQFADLRARLAQFFQPSEILVLPPAPCGPKRARKCTGLVALLDAVGQLLDTTWSQRTSSSSAISIGSEVRTPCPISQPRAPDDDVVVRIDAYEDPQRHGLGGRRGVGRGGTRHRGRLNETRSAPLPSA